MNKNKELVDVKINENGLIDEVIEVKDIKYLPVGIDNDKDIKAQLNKGWQTDPYRQAGMVLIIFCIHMM